MPVFNGATFPAIGWLPNPDQLNDVGEGILDVALGALTQFSTLDSSVPPKLLPVDLYERRVVAHGTEAPVDPSKRRQISVVCSRVSIGRAGEDQSTFAKGALGTMAFETARFQVELSQPYPVHPANTAIDVPSINAVRASVWRDGLVVWAALRALTMGGVTHPAFPSCNNLLLGPLEPRDPAGGEASWVTTLSVQL